MTTQSTHSNLGHGLYTRTISFIPYPRRAANTKLRGLFTSPALSHTVPMIGPLHSREGSP
jgi:hypothetical protein